MEAAVVLDPAGAMYCRIIHAMIELFCQVRAVALSPMRVLHVVNHTRPVTAELALLFGRAFGQSPQYWLNLQAAFDLKKAEAAMGERLLTVCRIGSGVDESDVCASVIIHSRGDRDETITPRC